MGFKSLFIAEDKTDNKPEVKKESAKFPTEQNTPSFNSDSGLTFPSSVPTQQSSFTATDNIHLDKFAEMYENGFNSLNKDGYDFYEFYQAIMNSGGVDNPQMYVMAMSMGSSMDKSVTKTTLLSQADFYLNEINKVYNDFVNKGNTKRQELMSQKQSENQSLSSDVANLKSQLEAITNQIRAKESQLSSIDNKYQPLISEIEGKLAANDTAKNNIVSNITRVKNGINSNIK